MNKSTGMIATIAAVILCGCPGFFLCIFGAITASGNMPYNTEVNGISNSGMLPAGAGIGMLCFSLLFILIPVGVGFFTLRKKPATTTTTTAVEINDEPLPPAS